MDVKLRIEGLDGLRAQLDRVVPEVRGEVAEGLGRAARTVAEETASDTPVRTGRAKAGLRGMDGRVTSTGAEAEIISTGTPSAYFVASEQEILEHDAEEEVVRETVEAMERALRRVFR